MGAEDDVTGGVVDAVAIAASLGGLDALKSVLGALPEGFPAPVLVVQHRPADYRGMLAEILGRHTPLRVKEAEDGETLRNGTVYLAPPGSHLLVNAGGALSLSHGPKVRHVRPSADPLFESIALVYGPRAIAVVLTGGDSDGSAGVKFIRKGGGVVVAQDPQSCAARGMPESAIATGCVDHVLPLGEIGPALAAMVTGRSGAAPVPEAGN